jgi:hypothetical protein
MHHFLHAPDDVIAVAVEDRITAADLDALMDRLEACLARHDPVHMYVETRSIGSLELAGFGAHLARAMPLMGQLRRFGRVAVVADQAWMRAGSRAESAMLPFVRYRVFTPERQAEALAWVTSGTEA